MNKKVEAWVDRITNLSGEEWWRACEIEEVKSAGRSTRWILRDHDNDYRTAMVSVGTQCSGAAFVFSLTVQKSFEPNSAAALIRLSVKDGDEQQFWDVTFDPASGEHKVPRSEGHAFGQVTDNLDSWRVSVAALVRPEVTADVQACIGPAIGPRPGVYAADAKGEITVRDVKFRRLRIDEFLKLTSEWAGAGAPA